MTDATNPVNGQPSYPEFARNPGSAELPGYGAPAGEETLPEGEGTLVAPGSGKTSGWPSRPAAANPAGWFPSPVRGAAPPVRHREPARSDESFAHLGSAQPGPASLSSILPSFTPHSPASPSLSPASAGHAAPAQVAPAQVAPGQVAPAQEGPAQPGPVAAAPAQAEPWPSPGPQRIRVVGPTEALRGRAGGPGVEVPRGAVPGLLSHERESGWQLAQRVWQDSGTDWDTPAEAGPDADLYAADPYAASQYLPGGPAPDQYWPASGDLDRYVTDEYAGPADVDSYADDDYASGSDDSYQYADDDYANGRDDSGRYAGDGYAAAPDDGAADPYVAGRYAAAPVAPTIQAPADSRLGPGPWPVQPGPVQVNPTVERPGDRRLAPPLPPSFRPRAQWDTSRLGQDAGQDAGQAPLEDRSGRVPLPPPAFRAPAPSAPPLSGESDELYRAWQGSVQAAVGGDRPGPHAHWSGGSSGRRPGRGPVNPRPGPGGRGQAWSVVKIGVPAVVVVTVGAVALLMLTGRANDVLAAKSSTGASPGTGATASPGASGAAGGTAAGILSGYPGEHGSVRVTAMWSANGTTLAAGFADMHPALWRRTADGAWSLVSAAVLGTMSGHLTSIAHGADGWIAVGSAASNGRSVPVVYESADGATWRPMPDLTTLAGPTAQFLGVAAGPGGYLVVGKQGTGQAAFAQFWWSADLKHWTATGNGGYTDSFAAAAVATGDGFVAAGSQGDCHTVWTTADGRHWTTHDIAKPAGAQTASLRYAATGPGGQVVTAGFAANAAGYLPIVVTSADNGKRIGQVVLPTAGVPGTVTGVTATTAGFVAVGQVGAGSKQQTVFWTSPNGVTWSGATPVSIAASSKITAVARVGTGVTGTEQQGTGPTIQAIRLK